MDQALGSAALRQAGLEEAWQLRMLACSVHRTTHAHKWAILYVHYRDAIAYLLASCIVRQ
jgi:hypothetical protein